MLQPVWEGEFGTSSVTLVCSLSGYFPDKLTVEWRTDGLNANLGATNRKLQSMEEKEQTFSLTSEMKPDKDKWNSGTRFTCKSTHNSTQYIKTISVCDVYASVPPSIHVEIPSLETVMKAASEVQATCLVRTVFNAKVTWVADGKIVPEGKRSFSRNTTDLTSILTFSTNQWKQLKLLTCKVEHSCFSPIERTINLAETSATVPLVEIRRSLPDLQKRNSFVLECDVTQLSSSDIFITFQANGTDMSDRQYVKLPKAPGLHSISRRFTVPSSHWNKTTRLTCKVSQGFTGTFVSESTGTFIADPSVELLLVPTKETEDQKLLCIGRGFDPQILWLSESQKRPSLSDDFSMDAQGHVTVTSQLQISQTEWETGKVFTCEIRDKSLGKNARKNISIFSVHCAARHHCSNQTYEGHFGKSQELEENCSFCDELSCGDVDPDMDTESWHMAFAFLLFFLIAIVYSVIVTLVKTKK